VVDWKRIITSTVRIIYIPFIPASGLN